MSRVYSIGNTNIRSIEINDGNNTCIIVSVNSERESEVNKDYNRVVEFKYTERFPFKVNYKDPARLGRDRLAFATFAFYEGIFPVYLLDAGTFITLDFFDGKTLYPISITPGFGILMETLKKGYNLRSLIPEEPESPYPLSTEESLYNGIFRVLISGIESFMREETELLLTGGDAEQMKKTLKRGVIVKNAVLYGAYRAFNEGLI